MSTRSRRNTLIALVMAGVFFWSTPAIAAWAPPISIPKLGIKERGSQSLADGLLVFYHDADTIGIAAHRTTYRAPFYHLDRLRPGDRLWVAQRAYVVRQSWVLRPWQTWPLRLKGVILSACTPRGSAAYRLVVHAAPV